MNDGWLDKVNWAQDGLVPAVAQEAGSGRVLTVAWMNREALEQDGADRRSALLVALAQEALAQGRGIRPRAESASRSASTATRT